MRFGRLFLLYVAALLTSGYLVAQDYYVEEQYITAKQGGLSNRRINDIAQSSEGYIWLATDYGLNRYDGQHFITYTHSLNQLHSDKIKWVRSTRGNLLWLFYGAKATTQDERPTRDIRQIDIFDIQTERAHPLQSYFPEAPFRPQEIEGFRIDDEGRLWLWTRRGVIYYFDGQFKQYYQSPNPTKIDAILPLPERDELWYSTNRELRRIDARGQLIELDSLGFYPQEIVRTADEVLWLPTWRRQAYQPGIKELLFYKRPNDPVSLVESDQIQIYNYSNDRSFTQTRVDPKGRIWNFDGNRLEVISERWLWRKGLTKTLSKARTGRITSIYFDRNDLAFVGTEDGFFIFNLKPNRFTPFLKEEGESTRAIVDYYPDSILVFTYGHNYMIHKFNGGKRILPELSNANVFGAIVDSSGVIWAGNHSNRLYRIDPRTAERKPYFFKKEQELQGFVLIPHLDERTGRIWLATQKGLAYLDPGMEELLWYFPGKDFERLNELTITHFHQNEAGLWLSTNQGIFLHRVGEGIVKHYDRFPYASINHIYEDEAGIFWLSTLGGGLLRWDYRREGEVRQFVEEDGLSDTMRAFIFFSACASNWRTRSFEMPRRLPSTSSVTLSSVRRRSEMISVSRSFRTCSASAIHSLRLALSRSSMTCWSGVALSSGRRSCHCASPSTASGAFKERSDAERREAIFSTSRSGTPRCSETHFLFAAVITASPVSSIFARKRRRLKKSDF